MLVRSAGVGGGVTGETVTGGAPEGGVTSSGVAGDGVTVVGGATGAGVTGVPEGGADLQLHTLPAPAPVADVLLAHTLQVSVEVDSRREPGSVKVDANGVAQGSITATQVERLLPKGGN